MIGGCGWRIDHALVMEGDGQAKPENVFTVPSVDEMRHTIRASTSALPLLFGRAPASLECSDQLLKKDTTARDSVGNVAVAPSVISSVSSVEGSLYSQHVIVVNPVQKRNPLLQYVRSVPWELRDIVPDFVMTRTSCALFLSIKYNALYPDYIHTRLQKLGKLFDLRVLIILVDMEECRKPLEELAKLALMSDCTMMVAWSYEEAARYLELYRAYENKPPDILMERMDSDFSSRVIECLTTAKKVNRTDAATLIRSFGTVCDIVKATKEELTMCPGLGSHKADKLHSLFHEPFIRRKYVQQQQH